MRLAAAIDVPQRAKIPGNSRKQVLLRIPPGDVCNMAEWLYPFGIIISISHDTKHRYMGAKCIHFSRAICGLESSLRPVYDAAPFPLPAESEGIIHASNSRLSNDHLLRCPSHCSDAGVRQLYWKSCGRDRWRFHSRHAQWEGRAGQTDEIDCPEKKQPSAHEPSSSQPKRRSERKSP